MLQYARPLQRVIEQLQRLPGIGPKSAQRLAFHILRSGPQSARELGEAISALPDAIGRCSICHNYTEKDICEVCSDPRRDSSLLCVVGEVSDLMALERSGSTEYHVLGGLLTAGGWSGELTTAGCSPASRRGDGVILATSPPWRRCDGRTP